MAKKESRIVPFCNPVSSLVIKRLNCLVKINTVSFVKHCRVSAGLTDGIYALCRGK